MIQGDADVLFPEHISVWSHVMEDYVEKYKDNMTSRNVLEQRNLGSSNDIDIVTNYDRTGPGAQIVAKGSAPEKNSVKSNNTTHNMYQLATSFDINARDMKLDPKLKSRLIDICMRDIHRLEDTFALYGSSKLNVNGIIDAADANKNGSITSSTNHGSWDGLDTTIDIYADVNNALALMDDEFEPAYMVGTKKALNKLNNMNSERVQFYKEVAELFGVKNTNDKSWMWKTNALTSDDYVYIVPKDFMAAEYVVSENPRIVPYGLYPGENYHFEIISWSAPEVHNNEAFVKIQIT